MIKDNQIDLTEHRDFRERNSSPLFITRPNGDIYADIHTFMENNVYKQLYNGIPWRFKPKHLERYHPFDGLIALGNKEMRKEILETYYWGSTENKTCDCCGREYKKVPWEIDFGLCKKCREYHNNYRKIDIFPWR